ncbi:hypothetical protein OROMI_003705 [Orobanche minor]
MCDGGAPATEQSRGGGEISGSEFVIEVGGDEAEMDVNNGGASEVEYRRASHLLFRGGFLRLAQCGLWEAHSHVHGKQVLVVTNTTIAPLYLDKTIWALTDGNPNVKVESVILPDGEQFKNTMTILRFLAIAGANPNGISVDLTPLSYAASESDEQMIKCLLEAGADPNMLESMK